MTPWEIVEEALQRKRPPRGPKWLADELGMTLQAIGHWKNRGVPPGKYRAIGIAIGLTVDQLEGLSPLPWEGVSSWPFPDMALLERVKALEHDRRVEIQAKIREMVEKLEAERRAPSGKLSTPTSAANAR